MVNLEELPFEELAEHLAKARERNNKLDAQLWELQKELTSFPPLPLTTTLCADERTVASVAAAARGAGGRGATPSVADLTLGDPRARNGAGEALRRAKVAAARAATPTTPLGALRLARPASAAAARPASAAGRPASAGGAPRLLSTAALSAPQVMASAPGFGSAGRERGWATVSFARASRPATASLALGGSRLASYAGGSLRAVAPPSLALAPSSASLPGKGLGLSQAHAVARASPSSYEGRLFSIAPWVRQPAAATPAALEAPADVGVAPSASASSRLMAKARALALADAAHQAAVLGHAVTEPAVEPAVEPEPAAHAAVAAPAEPVETVAAAPAEPAAAASAAARPARESKYDDPTLGLARAHSRSRLRPSLSAAQALERAVARALAALAICVDPADGSVERADAERRLAMAGVLVDDDALRRALDACVLKGKLKISNVYGGTNPRLAAASANQYLDFAQFARLASSEPFRARCALSGAAAAEATADPVAQLGPSIIATPWATDADGDLEATQAKRARAEQIARLERVFRERDRDNTGSLSRADFGKALQDFHLQFSATELKQIVEIAAAGRTGAVNYGEFVRTMALEYAEGARLPDFLRTRTHRTSTWMAPAEPKPRRPAP